MNRKSLLLIAVMLALVIAASATAWGLFFRTIDVQVSQFDRDVPVQVFGLGTVEARVTSKVGFKVAGVLVDLSADVGDRIAKGTVLARLDDREQRARVSRAKASTEQTEANFQKASASLQKAQVNFTNVKNISERRQQLVATSSASVESAETAKTVQEAAAADVNLATSEVAVARATIGDAKGQLQLETATLDFHILTAPYDAMVIARLKELGSALGAGEPVFTLIDPLKVWVLAYIDESKAGEIKVGDSAEFVLRSLPKQRIRGQVARIVPESDRVNEERRIEVAFDRIPTSFNLGEQAEVYITTVRLPQALLVPEAAITRIGKSEGMVWTVEEGRLQQNTVTLGHRLLDGRYEITGGVPERARVVTQLVSGLRVGRAAKMANEQRP